MEDLGRLRNQADYQRDDPKRLFSRTGLVEDAIDEASEAITLLDEIGGDESRRTLAIESLGSK